MRCLSLRWVLMLCLAVIIAAACGSDSGGEPDEPEGEPFVIGVLESLTGVGETYGVPISQSKLLAAEEINAAGGINGRPLKLVVEDSKCTANDAITAFHRLADVEGIKIILGATCSSGTLGVAPLAEKKGIVLLSASSTSPDVTNSGDYIFRTAINSLQVGTGIGNTLWADGIRRVATITESTDYAEGIRRTAVEQYEKLGGAMVAAENYSFEVIDFRTQITKLIGEDPDAILVAAQAEASGGTVVKQIRELGYEGPLYSEVVVTAPAALNISGEAATGLKAVVPNPDLDTKIGRDFLTSYKEKYGTASWPWFQGSAYDDVYIAAECLRQTDDDQDADGFRDCLYEITWSGAIGDNYGFDVNGDVTGVTHVVIEVLPLAERTEENLGYKILGPPPTP